MEKLKISVNIIKCHLSELDKNEAELVEAAKKATENSYSPYSHFQVGAAIRLSDGRIIIGANQENAAFSVTICAERSAIFAAQAHYPHLAIKSIAIAARNKDGYTLEPVSPCGSCRQAIVEIEQRYSSQIRILLYGKNCVYTMDSIRNLMPLSFTDMK